LHDPVTMRYAGEQDAQWDFQNNATRTSLPGPPFVLEVPLTILQLVHQCVLFSFGVCVILLPDRAKPLFQTLL